MRSEEEEVEYDVYFRGTKEQLFAFLYPLSGPNHSLFDHLELSKTLYDVNHKSIEMRYAPKDFQNIDKQKEEIVYKSTLLPIQSNYFYSVFQPDYNCFVWQSIDNMLQMRPKSKPLPGKQDPESITEMGKVELEQIGYDHHDNKAREVIEDTIVTPLKENWQISKQEYLSHLAK